MKLVWVLSAVLLALTSTLTPVDAQCGARVRKDWDSLTTTEKDTYKGALAAAMDSGAYIKFVEMHTEMRSEMEAHRQCMFIYWHRLLLVVFENMLRGQGSQYACVTVPYYNWVGANNRVLNGACSSLGDCSSITSELGGYTTGTQRTVAINGINNSGRCAAQSPLDHFCQSGVVSGASCVRCVPRGDWGSASVPGSTSYASVRQQVFNGRNIGQMSPLVEQGCHNSVHSNLGGSMGTFASPSDPIFWSHHSMVDALHTIFHKCRVGTQRLSFAQKVAQPVAWTSCSRRDGGTFSPTDVITMRTGVNGVNPIEGSQDPLIGQYFSGVPNQFAGLMDVRDLGASSYSYELSGQLADMYNNCDGTSAPTPTPSAAPTTSAPVAPTPVPVASPAPAPVPAPAPAPVAQPTRCSWFGWFFRRCGNWRRLEAEHGWGFHGLRHNNGGNYASGDNYYTPVTTAPSTQYKNNAYNTPTPSPQSSGNNNVPSSTPAATPSPQYDGNSNNNRDVVIVNKSNPNDERVSSWYDQTVSKMGGQCAAVMEDMERQACMFQDQCMGGTAEYTAEFKKIWGVEEPRCLTIVNAIKNGEQSIQHESWREDMESFFGCPNPTSSTPSADQSGGYGNAVQSVTDTISSVVQSV